MIKLLKKLVQADTTCKNGEIAATKAIAEYLAGSRVETAIDCWDQGRANIIAKLKSGRKNKALLFACHLDVVPQGQAEWEKPVFSGIEADGRIYGRGAADMKGGTAACIAAIRQIAESNIELKGDIIFLGAAGEETDSCGAKKFVQDNIRDVPSLAGIIIPEPTDFDIITAHRGLLWLQICTYGKTAHGSMPHLGINAITAMNRLINKLQNYKFRSQSHELLGGCSMSINTIKGGNAVNVVPDKCTIEIDFRTIPAEDHTALIEGIKNIFAMLKQSDPGFNADVSIVRDTGALETDNNSEFVKNFCAAAEIDRTGPAGFCTDGPFLTSLSKNIVIFGPGKPHLCHKPDEYIDICDVEKATEYYKKIIIKFLA